MPNLLTRKIKFGGVQVPASIAAAPVIPKPTRKTTVVQIPGTSREVVQMEDAWETYEQPYTLFVGDGSADSIQAAIDNVEAVLTKKGWQQLEDDYDPNYFRLAYHKDGYQVQNKKTRVGLFDIAFICRAEKYLKTGNVETAITSGTNVKNETVYAAKPLIKVECNGSGTLIVGSTTILLADLTDYIYIDSDVQDCYRQAAENMNSHMTGEYPLLNPGNNVITFSGDITAVKITPRFYVI